ncbi:hypothetical protein CBL_07284 [Carabus blaptoides fortunei]
MSTRRNPLGDDEEHPTAERRRTFEQDTDHNDSADGSPTSDADGAAAEDDTGHEDNDDHYVSTNLNYTNGVRPDEHKLRRTRARDVGMRMTYGSEANPVVHCNCTVTLIFAVSADSPDGLSTGPRYDLKAHTNFYSLGLSFSL